ASRETRQQDCLTRLRDIEPLSEYRRLGEFLRLRSFLLSPITTAQSFFRAALAPLQPSEVESAPRFRERGGHPGPFRLRAGPMQRGKPWQWLEHCGRRPSAHGKRILKIAGAERYLESIRRGQGQFACKRYESSDKAACAHHAPKPASIRRRKPTVRARNRQPGTHSPYFRREFPGSGLRFRQSRTRPWPAAGTPEKRSDALVKPYRCTRRRCEFDLEKLRSAEARGYSRC